MSLFFSPFFFLPFFFIFNNFDKPPFDLSLSLFNAEVTQGDQTHDPYLQLAVSTSLSSRLSLFLPDKKEIFSWGLIWAFYSTWTELNQNHEKVLLSAPSNISFTHAMEGGHWKQRRIVLTIRQTVDIRSIVQEKSSSSLYQYAAPVSGGWLHCDVTEVPFKVEPQVGFAGLGWCDYSFIALSFLYRKKNQIILFLCLSLLRRRQKK